MKLIKLFAPTMLVAVAAVACQQQSAEDHIAAGEVNDLPASALTAQPAAGLATADQPAADTPAKTLTEA